MPKYTPVDYDAAYRRAKETIVKDTTPAAFVDLGLPSGTLWADRNADPEYDTADGARSGASGAALPNHIQWKELKNCCRWSWDKERCGYDVTGPSGKRIFLRAAGEYSRGLIWNDDVEGRYWSRKGFFSFDEKSQSFIPDDNSDGMLLSVRHIRKAA